MNSLSDAIAVGSRSFVEKVQLELGIKAKYREMRAAGDTYTLREPVTPYTPIFGGENALLRINNGVFWERTF